MQWVPVSPSTSVFWWGFFFFWVWFFPLIKRLSHNYCIHEKITFVKSKNSNLPVGDGLSAYLSPAATITSVLAAAKRKLLSDRNKELGWPPLALYWFKRNGWTRLISPLVSWTLWLLLFMFFSSKWLHSSCITKKKGTLFWGGVFLNFCHSYKRICHGFLPVYQRCVQWNGPRYYIEAINVWVKETRS